jgi:hypothetical protein
LIAPPLNTLCPRTEAFKNEVNKAKGPIAMKQYKLLIKSTALIICASALFACGGDGGGGGGGAAPVADQAPTVGCIGANCSAVSATQYSGTGVGVWKYHNTSSNDVSVAVDITGVSAGKKVTLAFSNGASSDASTKPQLGTQVSTEVAPSAPYVTPTTTAVSSAESVRRAKHEASDLVHHQVQLKNQTIKIRLREQAAMQTQTFDAMPEAALASPSAPQFLSLIHI